MNELITQDKFKLLETRYDKYRRIGIYEEFWKYNNKHWWSVFSISS
jgi:hypothetical protein